MSRLIRSLGQGSGTKKCRLRFTYNDDLALLREFVGQNPLSNPEGWEVMKQNVQISTGKAFTIRTIKQHLILIIEIWIKKDELDKVRSGIEDAYSERDTLLQEASALCKEFNFIGLEKQKKKTPRDVQLLQLGKKVRNSYLGHLSTSNEEVTQINENVSSGTPEWDLKTWKECNQDNDTSTWDQENDNFFLNDHDYVNSVDIELELSSDKTNTETLLLEIDSKNNRTNNKRTLEVISPKNSEGWLESNFDMATSSENVTPKFRKNHVNQNSAVPVPARKRTKREPIRKNALIYLSEKNEKELTIRKKELELEERKIAISERRISLEEEKLILEKYKLDIECQERKQRVEAEKSEKEITYKILEKMMDTLIEKCNKV